MGLRLWGGRPPVSSNRRFGEGRRHLSYALPSGIVKVADARRVTAPSVPGPGRFGGGPPQALALRPAGFLVIEGAVSPAHFCDGTPTDMNLLLTNDDGISAPGLLALVRRFAPRHRVTVVAPDRERSAVGHGITLHHPLRAHPVSLPGGCPGFAVNGTPADCVKLAVGELLADRPDMVVSGINPGANVGANINYSGTVAAAKEAALFGLHAAAVSLASPDGSLFEGAAAFVETLAEKVVRCGLPFGTFLNVNLPDVPMERVAGIRICRQGVRTLSECFEKRTDPRNRPYYWQGADHQAFDPGEDIDGRALADRRIAVTPVRCDMTDYDMMGELEGWDWSGQAAASARSRRC